MDKKETKETVQNGHLDGVVGVADLIKFNTPDSHGDVFLPNSVKASNFQKLKVSGEILDFEINDDGIKIIKSFSIKSVSI